MKQKSISEIFTSLEAIAVFSSIRIICCKINIFQNKIDTNIYLPINNVFK